MKEKIFKMIEEMTQAVFFTYQKELAIPSGDITPDMALLLEEKQKELAEVIFSVLSWEQLSLKEQSDVLCGGMSDAAQVGMFSEEQQTDSFMERSSTES